jgi:hypothetical protein
MTARSARATGFLAAVLGLASCAAPCERLAERTCAREGDGSRACEEIRRAARRAGDDDQEHCREVLRILEGPGMEEGAH